MCVERAIMIATLFRRIRLRVRCSLKTRGLHEWDIATGRCRVCRRLWSEIAGGKTAGSAVAPEAVRSRDIASPQRG